MCIYIYNVSFSRVSPPICRTPWPDRISVFQITDSSKLLCSTLLIGPRNYTILSIFAYILQVSAIRPLAPKVASDHPNTRGECLAYATASLWSLPETPCGSSMLLYLPLCVLVWHTPHPVQQTVQIAFVEETNMWVDFLEVYPHLSYREVRKDTLNQTVTFQSATKDKDQRTYKCVGYGHGGATIMSTMNLTVLSCAHHSDKPIIVSPQQNNTEVQVGNNHTESCKAVFGDMNENCSNISSYYVEWSMIRNGHSKEFVNENSSDGVYATRPIPTDENVAMETMLHFHPVTRDDFHTIYICNAGIGDKNVNRSLRLREKPDHKTPRWLIIVLPLLGVLIAIVAITLIVFRIEVHLFLKLRLSTSPKGDKKYEVAVVYNCEDEKCKAFFDNQLYPKFEEIYPDRIYAPEQRCWGNESLPNAYAKVEDCRVIIFLLTDSFFDHDYCKHCLETTVGSTNCKLLFIIYGNLTNDVLEKQELSVRQGIKIGRRVKLKYDESTNQRHFVKFWKRLRLELPIPVDNSAESGRNRRRSSEQPLICGEPNQRNLSSRCYTDVHDDSRTSQATRHKVSSDSGVHSPSSQFGSNVVGSNPEQYQDLQDQSWSLNDVFFDDDNAPGVKYSNAIST